MRLRDDVKMAHQHKTSADKVYADFRAKEEGLTKQLTPHKRRGSGEGTGGRAVKRQAVGQGKFFADITACEEVSSLVRKFPERIVDSSGKHLLFVRDCYEPLYKEVLDLAPKHDGVIVTGTSGIGKTFLGVSCVGVGFRRLI
jgi:hypothetical protein